MMSSHKTLWICIMTFSFLCVVNAEEAVDLDNATNATTSSDDGIPELAERHNATTTSAGAAVSSESDDNRRDKRENSETGVADPNDEWMSDLGSDVEDDGKPPMLIYEGSPVGFEYLRAESQIKEPILKHYSINNALEFYPAWTYQGFNPPSKWQEVNIVYFTRPSNLPPSSPITHKDLKQHRSSMHICSKMVTNVMENKSACEGVMVNECNDNDTPSPINIIPSEAEEDESLTEFIFINYDEYYGFDIFLPEDGTDLLFVKLAAPKKVIEKRPAITKGSIGKRVLYLDRILFHIGEDAKTGSEHAFDGKKFAMEIQFYFTAKPTAAPAPSEKGVKEEEDVGMSYWEALAQYKVFPEKRHAEIGKNLHILSVMVKVGKPGMPKPPEEGSRYTKVMDLVGLASRQFWLDANVERVRALRITKRVMSMEDFFGVPTTGDYFTYEGSLSHPPCFSGAEWTIFEKPIWISYDAWLNILLIHSEYSDHKFMFGNYRPLEYIYVSADITTYSNMRHAQGRNPLDQQEINRLTLDNKITKPYTEFAKYFAKRVRKSKINFTILESEYDYYETDFNITKSGTSPVTRLHYPQHELLILIFAMLVFLVSYS